MNHTRRTRALSLLFSLALLLSLLPGLSLTAAAAGVTEVAALPTEAGNYRLTADVTIDSTWIVPEGETTLDLDGHGIRYAGDDYGSVIMIYNDAALTLTDSGSDVTHCYTVLSEGEDAGLATVNDTVTGTEGTDYFTFTGGYITGGTGIMIEEDDSNGNYAGDLYGSGVCNRGTFIMYGGTILGNKAKCYGTNAVNAGVGGGVCSMDTFTMYGGAILGNIADYGGGAYINGTFDMYGGEICGNSAMIEGYYSYGGGVCNYGGMFSMYGGVIDDNESYVGGGVYIDGIDSHHGAFSMYGGVIRGNEAYTGRNVSVSESNATFAWNSGSIASSTAMTEGQTLEDLGIAGAAGDMTVPSGSYLSGANVPNPLPEGCYQLIGDVTLSDTWEIAGNVTLDLNGFGVRYTGDGFASVISINDDAALTLTDSGIGVRHDYTVVSDGEDAGFATVVDGATPGALTFTGGFITGGTGTLVDEDDESGSHAGDLYGGGVCNSGTFTMYGGTILGNKAKCYGVNAANTGMGGGVCSMDTFTMYGGTILGNVSDFGGGALINYTFTMNGGEIVGNSAILEEYVTYGGGVDMVHGTFIMNGGTIRNNCAYRGGGAHVEISEFIINGGTIRDNTADGYGGGVNVHESEFAMNGGVITGNTAAYDGGNAYVDGPLMSVENGVVAYESVAGVDGTITQNVVCEDGTTGRTVTDGDGNLISASAEISTEAAAKAAQTGESIEVPIMVDPIPADQIGDADVPIVTLTFETPVQAGETLRVHIPTTSTNPGIVAFLRQPDGSLCLVKECGSVTVPVEGDCELVIANNRKSFSDVARDSWYARSVNFVTAREIFNGYGDEFNPEDDMTRAMVAQVLYNYTRDAKAGDGTVFSDVGENDWFNAAVGWASERGIVNGYGDSYGPLDPVSRQDLVTILYRYANTAGYDVDSDGTDTNTLSYDDASTVADYASAAMHWAISAGIIRGYEDNTLRPASTATRAEVAAIMQRFCQIRS